jgi:hypothetical protein
VNTYAEIQEAIGAHELWKGRLTEAIENRSSELQPSVVGQENQCDFGKWLHGSSLTSLDKKSPHYALCRELHRGFHATAAKILSLALAGKTHEATQAIAPTGEFTRLSFALTRVLIQWYEALADEGIAK